jgi:hypothetical protein
MSVATSISRNRSAGRTGRWARLALFGGTGLVLVLLHALLLWNRLTSLTLLEPMVLARYGAAVALLWGLARMRRSGISLWRGRRAMVFWLLVLMLHASAIVPAEGRLHVATEPGGALLLNLPLTLLALGAVAQQLARLAEAKVPRPAPAFPLSLDPGEQRALQGFFPSVLSPRPPPA